ncbi:hypothetical protein TPA0908_40190 [Micromonospora sp. AKA38]|nr:hypothetical protein TPA0908_40190 [Micromonospora sp. AKA38]
MSIILATDYGGLADMGGVFALLLLLSSMPTDRPHLGWPSPSPVNPMGVTISRWTESWRR